MKRLLKSISALVLAIILVAGMSFNTAAYVPFNKKMAGGVGQSGRYARCYWYDTSGFNSTWQSRIDHAMTAWSTTGSNGCGVYTSVIFYNTTTQSESVIDFHKSTLPDNAIGQTIHYQGTGTNSTIINPEYSDWIWAKVYLDVTKMNNSGMTAAQKRATVEHEIGHAFGLNENNTVQNSIMCQLSYGRTATRPETDDCNGINAKYGGYNP